MYEFNKNIKVTVIQNANEFNLSDNTKLVVKIEVDDYDVKMIDESIETHVTLLCDLLYKNQRVKTIQREITLVDDDKVTMNLIANEIAGFVEDDTEYFNTSLDEDMTIYDSLGFYRNDFLVQQYVEIESQ